MHLSTFAYRTAAAALVGVCGSAPLAAQNSAPYLALSNPEREFVNFNVETTRGMVFDVQEQALFAINTHGSRLLRFNEVFVSEPAESWTTLHNPVSLATWRDGDDLRIVVAGGSTHALAVHDAATGEILDLYRLEIDLDGDGNTDEYGSEPGDVVVLDDWAYVSCMGSNKVVAIDLSAATLTTRYYTVRSQRPRFLFVDESAGRVFVAPFISGNNTTLDVSSAPVLTMEASPPLDDQDLFELDVVAPYDIPAKPIVRNVGHLILAHGMDADGDYWMLSLNPDNLQDTEAEIKGDFADHILTQIPSAQITPPPAGVIDAGVVGTQRDLDDDSHIDSTIDYDENWSCSFPWSIELSNAQGVERIFVAGSTSDRIHVFDPDFNTGQFERVGKIDLEPGSIPRDMVVVEPLNRLLVYKWGENRIAAYPINGIDDDDAIDPPLPTQYELGIDPTPAAIKAGREHWYDARNSTDGRSSCNTCHPGGSSDFLGWPVSGHPTDRKDVMVTQPLLSIEDTFPYHWRGERELRDFNREAFPGLLGGTALNAEDFAEFKEFVFSLQAPRNPHQSLDRRVTGPDAVAGQTVFDQEKTAGPFSCNECHTMPSGSIGTMAADVASLVTSNSQFDSASLRMLYNKENPDGNNSGPLLGWGTSHDGDNSGVFDFLSIGVTEGTPAFDLDATERVQVAEFVRQFDQGIAPVAQMAWLLSPATEPDIENLLLAQANINNGEDWVDACAFGVIDSQMTHWLYKDDETFEGDNPNVLNGLAQDFDELAGEVDQPGEWLVFLGVPPVSGRVFALDQDYDGLDFDDEVVTEADDPDSDGDGFPDGYEDAIGTPADAFTTLSEVQQNDGVDPQLVSVTELRTSATSATFRLEFSEPVTYVIRGNRLNVGRATRTRLDPVTHDTIVLQGLKPSSAPWDVPGVGSGLGALSQYDVSIVMTDFALNSKTEFLNEPTTAKDHLEPFLLQHVTSMSPLLSEQPLSMVVRDLDPDSISSTSSTVTARVEVTVEPLHEDIRDNGYGTLDASVGRVVVAQVLKLVGEDWEIVPVSELSPDDVETFEADSYTLTLPQGAFSPLDTTSDDADDDILFTDTTDTNGLAAFDFSVSGIDDATQVRLNVIGIFYHSSGTVSSPPDFIVSSRLAWIMPLTQDDPDGDVTESHRFIDLLDTP